MASVKLMSESTNEINEYIKIKDYNKLKLKYDNKTRENKKLKEFIDKLTNSHVSIKDNKNSVEQMFNKMNDLIKTYKDSFKQKEEFSTSTSSYEYIVDNVNNFKSQTKSCNSNQINTEISIFKNNTNQININNLIKKVEEIESSYNDISKNFEYLIMKYKTIKEEKNKVDEHNIILLDQIGHLNNEYNNLISDFDDCHVTIERFKEIDKCILDSSINSLFLNTNEKKKVIEKDSMKFISNPYILCEPVPTFIKFINKYTK